MTDEHSALDPLAAIPDLSSPEEEIRRRAVIAVSAGPLEKVRTHLFDAMGDMSWRVRKEAVAGFLTAPGAAGFAGELVELLRSPDNAGLRNSAVEALVGLGGAAVPFLEANSRDLDPDVRKFVIDIMGGIGERSTLPHLVRALEDEDPNVRVAAAENLGRMGGEQAVPPLLRALERVDLTLRFTVLEALGRIGRTVPQEAVTPFLDDPLLKRAAYECLGSVGTAEAVPLIAAGLGEPSPGCREAAVRALMALRDRFASVDAASGIDSQLAGLDGTPAVECLLELLDSRDDQLNRLVIRLMGLIGDTRAAGPVLHACRNEELLPDCLQTLRSVGAGTASLLTGEYRRADEGERFTILHLCGELGLAEARSIVSSGLGDGVPQVREAAARAAGKIGLHELVPEIAGMLNDFDHEVRNSALQALESLAVTGGPAVAGVAQRLSQQPGADSRRYAAGLFGVLLDGAKLALLVKDEDERVRKAAVQGLAGLRDDDAVHHLTLALTDEDPGVRIAAAEALGETGRPDVLEPLLLVARDPDPWVRSAGLRSLGKIGGPEVVVELEQALKTGDDMVKLAVLDALGQADCPESRALVRQALKSGDGDVAEAAVRILDQWDDPWLDREGDALLGHPHWAVRSAVAEILARRLRDLAAPSLERALLREDDELVRTRMARILDTLR